VKVTVPVGVVTVPAEVSVTVAVHVVVWAVVIEFGEHVTLVDVVLGLTVTLAAALVDPLWTVSPP
jgi:Na+/H+ antiporter NhaA